MRGSEFILEQSAGCAAYTGQAYIIHALLFCGAILSRVCRLQARREGAVDSEPGGVLPAATSEKAPPTRTPAARAGHDVACSGAHTTATMSRRARRACAASQRAVSKSSAAQRSAASAAAAQPLEVARGMAAMLGAQPAGAFGALHRPPRVGPRFSGCALCLQGAERAGVESGDATNEAAAADERAGAPDRAAVRQYVPRGRRTALVG